MLNHFPGHIENKRALSSVIILLLILLFNCSFLNAQTITIGGGIDIIPHNKNYEYGFGVHAFGEYRNSYNLAYRGNISFLLANPTILFIGGDTAPIPCFEGDVLYYPFSGIIEPYAGAGLGYYMPSVAQPRMASLLRYGSELSNDLKSGLGLNAIAGFKLTLLGSVALNLEAKYIYYNPSNTRRVSTYTNGIIYVKENIDMSFIETNLSFIFRI